MNRCTFCGNKDNTDTRVVNGYTILESCEDCERDIKDDGND